jgi:hypothetical protein
MEGILGREDVYMCCVYAYVVIALCIRDVDRGLDFRPGG